MLCDSPSLAFDGGRQSDGVNQGVASGIGFSAGTSTFHSRHHRFVARQREGGLCENRVSEGGRWRFRG